MENGRDRRDGYTRLFEGPGVETAEAGKEERTEAR